MVLFNLKSLKYESCKNFGTYDIKTGVKLWHDPFETEDQRKIFLVRFSKFKPVWLFKCK